MPILVVVIGGPLAVVVGHLLSKGHSVEVLEVRPAHAGDDWVALEVIVQNRSELPDGVTTLDLRLRRWPTTRRPSALNQIDFTTYDLTLRLRRTAVVGDTNEEGDPIWHPAQGTFGVTQDGTWGLDISVPTRVTLKDNQPQSILVRIPAEIGIDEAPAWVEMPYMRSFLEGEPPRALRLADLIRAAGPLRVTVVALYGDQKRTAAVETTATFKR